MFYLLTACLAWLSSTIFHSHDTRLTELADYCSALATVTASLLAFCMR